MGLTREIEECVKDVESVLCALQCNKLIWIQLEDLAGVEESEAMNGY